MCIKHSMICDGFPDCPDELEEKNCCKFWIFFINNLNLFPFTKVCYVYSLNFLLLLQHPAHKMSLNVLIMSVSHRICGVMGA